MMIPIQALNRISLKSIIASVFSWLVCQGVAVWQPLDTPRKFRGAPPKIPPKSHPPMPQGH
jgi:hypothetical protein